MDDILEPNLVWVKNRCYRFCDSSAWSKGTNLQSYEEETYQPDYRSNDEEYCDSPIEIVPLRGDRLMHTFYVNSNFYRFIIGAKGTTLKRLEADTNTIIKVPRHGQNGNIEITGNNHRNIMAARTKIDLLIETSRSKLQFTHFISIPSNFDELKQNFQKFKEDVLKNCSTGVRPIKEEMFQKPERLHLTVIMLVLLDNEDRQKAVETLETCKTNVIIPVLNKHGPIEIEYRGVEIMNDDPSEVQILYIKAYDKNGFLQKISNDIADYFIKQGLTRRQYDQVKLHVTVMNTHFLLDEVQGFRQKREKFDASYILKEHENTFFGKAKLSTVHLSLRHSRAKDGYYQSSARIEL